MTALLRALALFTVAPVRVPPALRREDAVAALRRLPAIGGGLGAVAALPLAAARAWAPHAELVAAALAVALLALLTRGLHLDGLADTADGLGSRAPAERALEIMRRSDIGPFGVLAVVFVVLLDVAALTALPGGSWAPVAALAVAAATGRVAVLVGAHRAIPAAHTGGFGAFVAGSVPGWLIAVQTGLMLAGAGALGAAVSADLVAWVAAPAAALLFAGGFLLHARRRLGGVTGDVFGALVELGTAAALVGLAFS